MSFNFLRRSQRHWLKTDVKIQKKDLTPQGVAKKVYLLSCQRQSFCYCLLLFFYQKIFNFSCISYIIIHKKKIRHSDSLRAVQLKKKAVQKRVNSVQKQVTNQAF